MLYDVRKRWKSISVSPQMYFRASTLEAFASMIDSALNAQLKAGSEESSTEPQEEDYAEDAGRMAKQLPKGFAMASERIGSADTLTIFITGASGFLGANILANLLSRKAPIISLIVHIRATPQEASKKLKMACQAYSNWSDTWLPRLQFVTDDIDVSDFDVKGSENKVGSSSKEHADTLSWDQVAKTADVVIHNAAKVHWLTPCKSHCSTVPREARREQ